MGMSFVSAVASKGLGFLPDRLFVALQYWKHFGRFPRLANPVTLNEKLQWSKLHVRDPRLPKCVDKYLVREFVGNILDESYLIPLVGVYEDPSQIRYEDLPDQFVLKATHGSGWNLICHSKATFDSEAANQKMRKWLRTNFYPVGREWAYNHPTPRIVCEAFISDASGEPPVDYKFFCFHGEPKFIQVDYSRFSGHRRNLYTPEWELLPCSLEYPNEKNPPPAPRNLSQLLKVAAKLAAGFAFVRVDLYAVEDRIYFGELTFYPGKGVERFHPAVYDERFGALLDLSKV
ncbi:MAG TPA: ATP-grasp fold amidoligase family protein [Luteolibacter sp.]